MRGLLRHRPLPEPLPLRRQHGIVDRCLGPVTDHAHHRLPAPPQAGDRRRVRRRQVVDQPLGHVPHRPPRAEFTHPGDQLFPVRGATQVQRQVHDLPLRQHPVGGQRRRPRLFRVYDVGQVRLHRGGHRQQPRVRGEAGAAEDQHGVRVPSQQPGQLIQNGATAERDHQVVVGIDGGGELLPHLLHSGPLLLRDPPPSQWIPAQLRQASPRFIHKVRGRFHTVVHTAQ